MSFKKQFIKGYLKIQPISNEPGKLKVKINNLAKLDGKYKNFEKQAIELIKILPGIQEVETQLNTGEISILYDATTLAPRQVMRWLNTVIDVVIDQLNLITLYWESNLTYVMNTLENQLREKVKTIL